MTIQWGSWSYAGGNGLRVGIDLSMSGSTTIVAKYYLDNQYNYSGDVMTLSESGWYSGSDGFTFNATTGGGPYLIATHNRVNSSPGTTYTFGASVSGSYNGSTPSVGGVTIAVPPVAPSTPGVPSISNVTSTTFEAQWTAPSNWGGSDWCTADGGRYDVQAATNSGFTTGVDTQNSGDTIGNFSGKTPNTKYWVRVRAKNDSTAKYSSWSSSTTVTTLPTAPTAPTAPTITRVSDTQHTVAWTLNATTGAPYSSQQVQRSADGAPYATVATVTGSTTSYTDSGTSADHRYTWRVVAINAAGTGTSSASAAWQTTPAAPTGATATKLSSGDITVGWTNATRLTATTSLELQHSTDGGTTWAALATISSGTTTSYTHTSPGTATSHTYQVRADSTAGATLSSTWAVSNTVATPTPPNAPTGLSPNGGIADLALATVLSWVPNPTDGSPQSGFEVQHRLSGGSTWTTTGQLTSGTSSWTLPAATYVNPNAVEWQVRTWGQLTATADASPWSASATIQGSSTPTVAITTPTAGTITGTSSAAVAWAYFQAESVAQATWRVTLIDSGGVTLTVVSGTGTTSSTTLDGLTNGASYTIEVEVQSGDGLWATPATVAVTFSFAPPATIDVVATFDESSGAIAVGLYPEPYDGTTTVQQVGAYIERSVDGYTWVRLNSAQLDPAAAVLDTTAPTDGSARYRAIAVSSLPSTSTGATAQVDTGSAVWCYLSQGVGFATGVRFHVGVLTTSAVQLDQATQQFEGRVLPVLTSGTAVSSVLGVSGLLMDDSSTRQDVLALAKLPGPYLWRDPTGRVLYASMSGLSVQERTPGPTSDTLSLTLTEIDH